MKQYGELFRHFGQLYDGRPQSRGDGMDDTMSFDEARDLDHRLSQACQQNFILLARTDH